MRVFIILCSLAAVTLALPQYGGGSAGGLLGHHEPLKYEYIGLSGGPEDEEHGHEEYGHGREEYGHGHDQGHGLDLGGYGYGHEQQEEHGHDEHRGEGGFGGSHFQTPVDIHHEKAIHFKAKPEYHYDYHVAEHKTKDYKSKHESRDGYKVKGSYSLLEPDHKTIRVVDYVADKKLGFIAKVSYRKHH